MKILVCDDMKTMRKILQNALAEMGYKNILEAEDGAKGFEILEKEALGGAPVDVVVSDWNMPNMKGIDLLRKCRADKRFASLKFVLVTAETEASSQTQAKAPDARVDGFLEKPFTKDALQALFATIGVAKAA